MPVVSDAPVDPFAPEMVADPYPTYRCLLESEPWKHEASGYWVVSRYADVRAVVYDPRFSRSDFQERARETLGEGPLQRSFELFLLFRDPPDHTRLRRLIGQAFTPGAVERLRRQIQETVDELLAHVLDHGDSFDLIADLAYPLPVLVISALLGVPATDQRHFRTWSAAIADGMEATTVRRPDAAARGHGAAEEMNTYLRGLVSERRAQPRDDLLTDLIAARDGADRLSEDEVLATSLLLFFAGHETTVNLIGNGLLALLRHPDQLDLVRRDLSLIGNAVEELLRFDSPVQRTFRSTADAVDIGGIHIAKGERVMATIGAANHDPRQFPTPDALDVRRANAKQHLSFGGGIHYCIGAPLARLEAEIALATLLRQFPGVHLLENAVQWRPNLIFRGLQRLPIGKSSQ